MNLHDQIIGSQESSVFLLIICVEETGIGIVATVTVGDMDVAVEPSGMSLRRVTGKTMTINAA